jgi:hypothetical protein
MPAFTTRRLAGIRFVSQPPALPEKLPRMDIAVFVGFASAGPLHRPVVVEDPAHFATLFGDDLPLAWDVEKGVQTSACLAPAVRAFFRNGGRRCWVIRVAGSGETDLFPLPGLARLDGPALQPGFASARSPGSGFDAFRAATVLNARSFEVLDWDPAFTQLDVTLLARDELGAGDLLRLTFSDPPEEAFFLVQSVNPGAASPPDPRSQILSVSAQPLGCARWLAADELTPGPFHLTSTRLPGVDETAVGKVSIRELSPPVLNNDLITLDVSASFAPPPGSLVRLDWDNGDQLWFQLNETQLGSDAGSPPGRASHLVGRAFSWSTKPPARAPGSNPLGEILTFELRVQRDDTDAVRILDLGFAPAHSRYWNALPTDAQLFAAADFREAIDQAEASAWKALWLEASDVHFALAGAGDLGALFLPIGMSALAQPSMAAQHSGRPGLVRDGLAEFSSSLFLDSRLLNSTATTLLADADFIRYQTPGAMPLIGIHAALEIEETTLIAVPDAIQRGWHSAPPAKVPPPVPSPPRGHPGWWHFLECKPPESPPLDARAPDHGHFLKCDLRVLAAPDLAVAGTDASGAFTLIWSHPDADATFILEEATEPDYSDSVELLESQATSHTILARAAGNYYYRVRAEAAGESSDWSNGVVVPLRPSSRWEVNATATFQPDAILDLHRALLRLCAARGDLMAVLSLPEHFREDGTLAYLARLKAAAAAGITSSVLPLNPGEERAFSYGAVYHPWLMMVEESSRLLTTPPDGAATGVLARRSIARGAWIAPANEAFSGIVGLTPRIMPTRHLEMLLAQLNLIRQEPHGFLALNADTLSSEDELRPINVRRLLILLRRAALRLGVNYVFEPNDLTLRRAVQGAFGSLLQQLFMRGAFAGATPEASYEVVTDDTLNPPQSVELGRFFVDLKVAPALPMSFLTVRLVQMGERATVTEIL